MNITLQILILCVALIACKASIEEKNKGPEHGGELSPAVNPSQFLKLQTFPSCAETDAYIRANLRRSLADGFDQQRRLLSKYKSGSEKTNANDKSVSETSTASSAPEAFSKTNTQVAGVDEPDRVKTNGTHIFAISGSQVHISASWPAASMKKIATISLEGNARGLLLTEDAKLIVAYHPNHQNAGKALGVPWAPPYFHNDRVIKIALYDVADPAKVSLLKELSFYGEYLSMRRQGQLIRLVQTNPYILYPRGIVHDIDTWGMNNLPISPEDFDKRRQDIEPKNAEFLASLTLKSYLADWRAQELAPETDDPIFSDNSNCQNIYASEVIENVALTTITSLNLADGQLAQTALLAPANHLYASEGSLYLANTIQTWWWGRGEGAGSKTYLHKFKYESPTSLQLLYQGSGMVDGTIINQFAMDEYQDHLRIAVTDDQHVSGIEPFSGRPLFTSINRIAVLASGPTGLEVVGKSADLAPGEQIYSARFNGNKGYLVTFRQVDPLFTLDLRDPKNPKVVGELKVNGFSSYIHLIDDTHLLTVGQDADPNTGNTRGLKISVFDVSDPAKPSETFNHIVTGSAFSWSESQYDHKAFTWFASRGLLGIPVSGYRKSASNNWWDSYFSELQVFKIDLLKGIEARGGISVNDLYQGPSTNYYDWWMGAHVNRSVFADDYIYAISDLGIRAVHNQDLSSSISTVRFYP